MGLQGNDSDSIITHSNLIKLKYTNIQQKEINIFAFRFVY